MSLVERYEWVAAARGEAPAIEWVTASGSQQLSHAGLWARAGEIATALGRAGIGAEDVVALAHGRSPELVAAMLGVWRAGAAWLVVETTLPPARRKAMLRQAGARAWLGPEPGSEPTPSPPRAPTPSADAPPPASALAYVAFTSGSSGEPKGVRIEQHGLLPMLDAQITAFNLDAASRCLWVLAPGFDASVSDIWTALLAGGTLLIDAPDLLADPRRMLAVLAARAVTSADLPPGVLARLDPSRLPERLRTVIIGGEVADVEAARSFAARLRLVNVYGPTEATVCTSLECCPSDWRGGTLGRPLSHVHYRLVDDELWIGGNCLARDYADDAKGTAERFVEADGARWYRTGDRVYRDGDDWVFAGRLDRQVQLAGRRAEPEEVEAALRRIGVRAAVVPRMVAGRTILVAFVEWAEEAAATTDPDFERAAEQWSDQLRRRLPDWLLPRRWVALRALPRTDNGKLDLDRLAHWPLTERPRNPPTDALERRLADLFAEVLGVAAVARDDDFFELGGDSLALLTLLARAEQRALPLSASQVLAAPRPAALAQALTRGEEPELRSTAELAARIPPPCGPWRRRRREGVVLLTGATGFLGSRVRRDLLAHGRHVVALVRADDLSAARRRIGDDDGELLPGDLGLDRFGLSPAAWESLAARVNLVVHLAATVSLAASYESLAIANVDGTARALALAADAGAGFIHASTLSVFVASDRDDQVFYEQDTAERPCQVAGGYAQSKWVAEQAVRGVCPSGAIIRYGLLTAATTDLATPPSDWLLRFVRAVARLGGFPRGLDEAGLAFDATPVDYAARTTCQIAASGAQGLHTLHVAGDRPVALERLLSAIRAAGVPLRPLGPDELGDGADRDADAAILLGVARALDPGRFARQRALDLFAATRLRFDMAQTRALGLVPPAVDDDYLRGCVRAMLRRR